MNIQNIISILTNRVEYLKLQYKDEYINKIIFTTSDLIKMIIHGDYIIRNNTPQDAYKYLYTDIDKFYKILYDIAIEIAYEKINIYFYILNLIKYVQSVEYIIRPRCDAFIKKKNEYLKSIFNWL